jgi:hypothetical protein
VAVTARYFQANRKSFNCAYMTSIGFLQELNEKLKKFWFCFIFISWPYLGKSDELLREKGMRPHV